MYVTISYLLDNIYIRFGSKLYKQIVCILMYANCAHLVADFFLFCYERDFMRSLSDDNQTDINEAFTTTSRYLDDLLMYQSFVTTAPAPGNSEDCPANPFQKPHTVGTAGR